MPVRTPGVVSCFRSTKPTCPDHRIPLGLGFSAILLQLLAVRPVNEYNISMGGDTPQVIDLSQVAIPDQRHDGITIWQASQVEGLVGFKPRAGSSPVSGILNGKDLRQCVGPCRSHFNRQFSASRASVGHARLISIASERVSSLSPGLRVPSRTAAPSENP